MKRLRGIISNTVRRTQGRRRFLVAAAILGFGIIGTIVIGQIRAAVFTQAYEAESAAYSGNAQPAQLAGASGGSAITFGGTTGELFADAPKNVQVLVGGDDIAVTWVAVLEGGQAFSAYNVYRNGTKVATTSSNPDNGSAYYATQYIDKNVSAGQTYSYQIETVENGRAVSPKSAAVSATHPANSAPTPNITLDSSIDTHASGKKAWIEQYGVPALKTWYPKVAHQLSYPDYTPPTSFRLGALDAATYASRFGDTRVGFSDDESTIYLNPNKINVPGAGGYRDTIGGLISASTMMAFDQPSNTMTIPRWLYTGVAFYAELGIYNGQPWHDILHSKPLESEHYTDGRIPASIFLSWLRTKYDPNYVRKVVVNEHNRTFDGSLFNFSDGRNLDEAWAQLTAGPDRTGQVKSYLTSLNSCLDNRSSVARSGNQIQLWKCNASAAQKFTLHPIPGITHSLLIVQGYCAAAVGSGENSSVRLAQCDKNNVSQRWKKKDDVYLTNANSDRCLVPNLGGTGDGTEAVIANCNSTTSQRWSMP